MDFRNIKSVEIPEGNVVQIYDGSHVIYEPNPITGTSPLNFCADGNDLVGYTIAGNTVQNGTPSPYPYNPNLADPSLTTPGYQEVDGTIHAPSESGNERTTDYIPATGTLYAIVSGLDYGNINWIFYDADKRPLSFDGPGFLPNTVITMTPPYGVTGCAFIRISWTNAANQPICVTTEPRSEYIQFDPNTGGPIIPEMCGVRTENLFDESDVIYDGSRDVVCMKTEPYRLEANETVTVSLNYNATAIWLVNASNDVALSLVQNSNTLTYSRTSALKVYIKLRFDNGTPQDLKVMFNTGSSPLPYENFGYKIPVSSASTTTPIYLGEVQTTRKIKKLVLTGEEINEGTGNAPYWFYLPEDGAYIDLTSTWWICSHYQPVSNSATWTSYNSLITFSTIGDTETNKLKKLRIRDTSCATLSDFKAYLAAQYASGTPVTIWYVLAEPENAIVNEPLAKIGDYADEMRSSGTGVSIPTVKGQNVLTVETALPPSIISVKTV